MSRWTGAHSVALSERPLVAINFHQVADDDWAGIETVLARAAQLGPCLDLDALASPVAGPRVMVAFYDGHRDTGLKGADLCHRLGIRAFFFPSFIPEVPGSAELTDEDLRSIGDVHEVGFHSWSHVGAESITSDTAGLEVTGAVERIAAATGRTPRVGAWRGGGRYDERWLGNRTARELGMGHLLSNWALEAVPPGGAPRRAGHDEHTADSRGEP